MEELSKAQYDYIVSLCSDLDINDHRNIIEVANDFLNLTGITRHARLAHLSKAEASSLINHLKNLRDDKRSTGQIPDERQIDMFSGEKESKE